MALQQSPDKLHGVPHDTEIQMARQPLEDRSELRLDTHWSRFVYCDESVDEEPLWVRDDLRRDPSRSTRALPDTPVPIFRRGPARNDDICGDAEDPRDHVVPPELRARVAAANGDSAVANIPASDWLSGHALYRAAGTRRAVALQAIVRNGVDRVHEFAAAALASYRRRREMKSIYHTLQRLDDRVLRDLGFHRSEIMSVAAEAVEEAERTRVRTLRMPRAPR
jgi:uncharacterized protein YjiS (DUF1127 family)